MKAALRWMASNLPLAVLALVLATVAWTIAVEEADSPQSILSAVATSNGVFLIIKHVEIPLQIIN